MDTQNINSEELNKISDLPAEKIKAMQEYAGILHKKHPKWKPERIGRAVAKYFSVKLVSGKTKIYS